MHRQTILVIIGPTASSKSDLAIKLARKFNGEIVSLDSRQVYRGLDMGTGKVTRKEMSGIPHYLLDVADPKKPFSVSDYKKLASLALEDIVSRSKLPIVVGGTGFYLDALTGNITLPEVPPNIRLRNKLEKKSLEELFKLLKEKDPRRAEEIDSKNRVRLIRALEIIDGLGFVPKMHSSSTAYDFVYVGLKAKDLDKRIEKRLSVRLDGIISECKNLHKKGLTYKRMHELGLEYRYTSLYLKGKLTKKEFLDKLNSEIRKYAKRQMTYFKKNKEIRWYNRTEYKAIEKYARIALKLGD